MKKAICSTLLAGVLFVGAIAGTAFAAETKFSGSPYSLKGNLWIVQELKGNINNDDYADTVNFVVLRNKDNNMEERMWFEVRLGYPVNTPDDRKPKPFLVPLPEDIRGYNAQVELKNFVAGEKEQVFLTFDGGEKGPRNFAVVQIRADDVRKDAKLLFDSRTMARAIMSGEFIGKFRATVRVDDTKTDALLDLSGKKAFYVKEKIYNGGGKLLRSVALTAQKYDEITLGERDPQGVTQLNATIALYGANESDQVATVHCILKYDSAFASWKVMESDIQPGQDIKLAADRKK